MIMSIRINKVSDNEYNEHSSGEKLSDSVDNSDTQNKKTCDSPDDNVVDVLDDYIFPGYIAFYLWDQFVPPKDILLLFKA